MRFFRKLVIFLLLGLAVSAGTAWAQAALMGPSAVRAVDVPITEAMFGPIRVHWGAVLINAVLWGSILWFLCWALGARHQLTRR